jgi:predicted peroxiredoxin
VTPLAIILSGADAGRWRSALGVAAAQAALGGEVRLFVDALAVPMLASEPFDAATGSGLPSLRTLCDTMLELGGTITVCQTGLAECGMDATALDPRFAFGGVTGFLAGAAYARLTIA